MFLLREINGDKCLISLEGTQILCNYKFEKSSISTTPGSPNLRSLFLGNLILCGSLIVIFCEIKLALALK